MKNNKIDILIFLLLIINPILDIYWLNNSYAINILGVTLPTLVRFLIFGLIVLLYIIKTKDFKKIILYSFIILLYLILQFMNSHNYNNYSIIKEIRYIVVLILPLILSYIIYKININKEKIDKVFTIISTIYSMFIIIPTVFKFGIASYKDEIILGSFFTWFTNHPYSYITLASRGIFYWAIIAASLLSLIPIMYNIYIKTNKRYNMFLVFTLSLSCIMIGTRASSIGAVLAVIVLLILYLYFTLIKKELKFDKRKLFSTIIIILSLLLILPYSPANSHIKSEENKFKDNIDKENIYVLKDNDKIIDCENYPKELIITKINELDIIYFNDRFIKTSYKLEQDPVFWCRIINKTSIIDQIDNRFIEKQMLERVKELNNKKSDDILGIGYSTTSSIFNLERDFLYQYYSLGILGLILTVGIYPLSLLIVGIILLTKRKLNIYNCSLGLSLGLFMFFAYYSGNTLGSLGVTILQGIILGFLYKDALEK